MSNNKLSSSMGFKVLLIAILIAVLSIGIVILNLILYERQSLKQEAVDRTIEEWGGRQAILGPLIRVPFVTFSRTKIGADYQLDENHDWAFIMPSDFDAQVKLGTEYRNRGIHSIPLYQAVLNASGNFALPTQLDWLPDQAQVTWSKAELVFFVQAANGLITSPQLSLNGSLAPITRSLLPKTLGSLGEAFATRFDRSLLGTKLSFTLRIESKGGETLKVFPAGENSSISVAGDSRFVEFYGNFLPTSRQIDQSSFSAQWKIPALSRTLASRGIFSNTSSAWHSPEAASLKLSSEIDGYRMTERALKYALMFILTPFAGLFLFEILTKKRIHPLQYLFIGLAALMFYLILLSFSEQVSFASAFVIAAAAISSIVAVYCSAILGHKKQGIWTFVIMALLYVLLYFIIISEDNALLIGSMFLLGILSTAMLATRKIDWYKNSD